MKSLALICAIGLLAASSAAAATAAQVVPAASTGTVASAEGRGQGIVRGRIFGADGLPLANALVFVHSARPVSGPPLQCPTCYRECGSTARTAADGNFEIPRMSDDLRFTLLVFAEGHVPDWVYGVAPGATPFVDTLPARKPRGTSGVTFRGRVVDHEGDPIAGAVITPRGLQRADSRRFGSFDFLDPVTVTDSTGLFALASEEAWSGLFAEVRARSKVPAVFSGVSPDTISVLVLEDGVTVSGRLRRDGRPAPGVALGLIPLDRNAESAVSQDTVGTNERGEFVFTNVPPSQDFALYASSETTAPHALGTSLVTVGESGSVLRLPDLDLGPGHTLRGRFIVREGKPLPTGIQLTIAGPWARDARRLRVGPDGTFVVKGLPTESVWLNCSVSGFRIAAGSSGFFGGARRGVRVAVLKDTDVVLLLEPVTSVGF